MPFASSRSDARTYWRCTSVDTLSYGCGCTAAGANLLLPVIDLRRGLHQGRALDAGAIEREDLIERREPQGLLRHNPRFRQHLRILDRRFDFHRVLVDPAVAFDDVKGVGMERHFTFGMHPVRV